MGCRKQLWGCRKQLPKRGLKEKEVGESVDEGEFPSMATGVLFEENLGAEGCEICV